VKITRAYKTELAPTTQQRDAFARCAGTARFVYNWALGFRKAEYERTKKAVGRAETQRAFGALKRGDDATWLREIPSRIPLYALLSADKAFANFFRRLKNRKNGNGKLGFPRFKARARCKASFQVWGGDVRIEADRIRLPKLGWIRLKERGYLPTEGRAVTVTISERAGRWFVAVQIDQEIDVQPAEGPAVGIDLGISALAVVSDGRRFENNKRLGKALRKLRRAQRRIARRQKGGQNRRKAVAEVAGLHYRIACLRANDTHQATAAITGARRTPAERPASIGVEDLNVSGMMKNHHLARALADANMRETRRQIEYKAGWYGSEIVTADRWYPSSKTCSRCGTLKDELDLSVRVYVCDVCGLKIDRDLNAAKNLEQLTSSTPRSGETDACGEEGKTSQSNGEAASAKQEPCLLGAARKPIPTYSVAPTQRGDRTGDQGKAGRTRVAPTQRGDRGLSP